MQVLLELFQFEPLIHRHRVSDDVQIVVLEIHNPLPGFILDEGIGNRPLLWDGPVKTIGSARNGLNVEVRNLSLKNFQRLSRPAR
jgi:hypothetical protein